MVRAIERLLTFFVVIVLFILLLQLLGGFIAKSVPDVSLYLRDILHSIWFGFVNITHPSGGGPGPYS